MRTAAAFFVCAGAALLAILLASSSPHAQPVTSSGGLSRVIHDRSLAGSGTSSNPLGVRTDCTSTQILAWNGTSWACSTPAVGDITGVTVTSPACSAGSFVATLTGGAATGDAPVGGTCVAEVGDISAITATANMGLQGGGTSGALSVGLLSTCANGQVLVAGGTGTTWTCGSAGGESTIAGAGLTLGGVTVDLIGSSDFSVGADLLDLSTAVTAPGTLNTAGTLTAGDASTDAHVVNGSLAVSTGVNVATLADNSALNVGHDTTLTTTANRGVRITPFTDGNNYYDLKTHSGGSTIFRVGEGAAAGSTTTWLTVDSTAGATTWAAAATLSSTLGVTGLSTLTGGFNSSAGPSTVGDFRGTVISPSATGALNDYAPTGIGTATVIDIAPTGGIDLTGISGGALGRIITVRNANGIGYTIVLYDESASSTAANRLDLGGDTHWTLRAGSSMTFVYTAASRWSSIGHSGNQFPGIWTTGDITMGGASILSALNYTGTGTLTIGGNTTLGDANTDTVSSWGKTYYYGTAPTLTGCTTQCSMASYSTDARGRIICTDGSTAATCTVTFSVAYSTNPPSCTLQYENATADAGTVYLPTITAFSTSAFSFKEVVAGAAHGYAYHCDGML